MICTLSSEVLMEVRASGAAVAILCYKGIDAIETPTPASRPDSDSDSCNAG